MSKASEMAMKSILYLTHPVLQDLWPDPQGYHGDREKTDQDKSRDQQHHSGADDDPESAGHQDPQWTHHGHQGKGMSDKTQIYS